MELKIESKLRIREAILNCKQDDDVDGVIDAVLAEVLPVVLAPMNDEEDAEYINSDVSDSFEWVRKHRLARFTVPKDAAVERIIGPRFRMVDGTLARLSKEAAALIADTVRAADREAGR